MKTLTEMQMLVNNLIEKAKDWLNVTVSMGNQDAYTDRMCEDIIQAAHKLENAYNDQFEKQTYYIVFEQQGYEQLIVKVEAPDENTAYDIANEAYLGDSIDRYVVDPKNLGRYDCAIINTLGEQLDYSDCINDDEKEGE